MALIGHTHIVDYFKKVMAAKNESHAYLFVGLPKIGKMTAARTIAQELLGVSEKQFETHPDVLILERGVNEKTGKTNKQIGIESMRAALSFLQSKPFVGSRKIVIVDGAEHMSIAAANALLKSLEEPAKGTHIFLLATDETRMPATIRSRTQRLLFSPVPQTVLASALATFDDMTESRADMMAQYARGCPGIALEWIEDNDAYNAYLGEVERFASLRGMPLYQKMQTVEPLFGDKKDHIATRTKLKETLGIWQLALRDSMIEADVAGGIAIEQAIREARAQLDNNIHPKLLVEHILLAIP